MCSSDRFQLEHIRRSFIDIQCSIMRQDGHYARQEWFTVDSSHGSSFCAWEASELQASKLNLCEHAAHKSLVHTVHRLVLLLLLQEKLLPQAQSRVSIYIYIYIYIDKPEPNQAAVEGASAG